MTVFCSAFSLVPIEFYLILSIYYIIYILTFLKNYKQLVWVSLPVPPIFRCRPRPSDPMFIIFKTGNIGSFLANQTLNPFQKVRLQGRLQIVREDCTSRHSLPALRLLDYSTTLSNTFTQTLTRIDTYAIMNAVHGGWPPGGSSMRLTRAAMQPTNFSREFPRICYYKQRNSSYEN